MNGFKQVVLFVFVLGLLAMASSASADVTLFQDDFQSDTVGENPAIGVGDIGGTWTTTEGAATYVSVDTDGVGNNYAKMARPTGGLAGAKIAASGYNTSPTLNNTVTLSAKVNVNTANEDSSVICFNSDASPDMFDIYLHGASDSVYFYDRGTSVWTQSLTLDQTKGTWEDLTVVLNTTARTFSMQLGSTSDTGSWTSNTHQIGSFSFEAGGTATEVFVDNVQFSAVPEPGTLALLLAGGLGLLAYAWRKRK